MKVCDDVSKMKILENVDKDLQKKIAKQCMESYCFKKNRQRKKSHEKDLNGRKF